MLADREDTQRVRRAEAQLEAVEGPRDRGVITVLKGVSVGAVATVTHAPLVIGRSPEVDLPILDRGLSRNHARIERRRSTFYIVDLGSTNGTFVDGRRVAGPTPLADGSRIELGAGTILRFGLHDAVEAAAAHRSHELTIRDPLTGVFNRRYMEQRLESEVAFAKRHATHLSLVMVDVDDFKSINDEYGHVIGDETLRAVATSLAAMLRSEDLIARYGGEEFLVLARGIGPRGAAALGERLRRGVERTRVQTPAGSLGVTVSVGVAHERGNEALSADTLLATADAAMYEAKQAGRNRVTLSGAEHRERLRSGMRARSDAAPDATPTAPDADRNTPA